MPEPDFDQIARELVERAMPDGVTASSIAGQLRYVWTVAWNARGVADLDSLERIIEKLGDTMDPDNARRFVADALREVDR